jgi:hypothetical protein
MMCVPQLVGVTEGLNKQTRVGNEPTGDVLCQDDLSLSLVNTVIQCRSAAVARHSYVRCLATSAGRYNYHLKKWYFSEAFVSASLRVKLRMSFFKKKVPCFTPQIAGYHI